MNDERKLLLEDAQIIDGYYDKNGDWHQEPFNQKLIRTQKSLDIAIEQIKKDWDRTNKYYQGSM